MNSTSNVTTYAPFSLLRKIQEQFQLHEILIKIIYSGTAVLNNAKFVLDFCACNNEKNGLQRSKTINASPPNSRFHGYHKDICENKKLS
jgi:hypothetical protein